MIHTVHWKGTHQIESFFTGQFSPLNSYRAGHRSEGISSSDCTSRKNDGSRFNHFVFVYLIDCVKDCFEKKYDDDDVRGQSLVYVTNTHKAK
jgi:hypothetical protein